MVDFESKQMSRQIAQTIYDKNVKIATAESCTGGKLAETLVAVPGSSQYFEGAIVAYSEEMKMNLLGVDPEVLAEKTAVSEEVAIQMVKGVIEKLGVDYAIATTGFAGPTGGTSEIPVGTIWIAVGSADKIVTKKMTEDAGRERNVTVASDAALKMMLDFLLEEFPAPEIEAVELKM